MKRSKQRARRLPSPITVVTNEAAEDAAYVLCVPDEGPAYFSDDVHTTCHFCERPIRHRPHAPKRPPKICIRCAYALTEQHGSSAN